MSCLSIVSNHTLWRLNKGLLSCQVKIKSESSGFPITALREINVLLSLQHENIISVKEMVVGSDHEQVTCLQLRKSADSVLDFPLKVYMVMEYMEHDIKMLMDKRMTTPFTQSEVWTIT